MAMILPATEAASGRTARWRAVVAVLALYAFALHAALGGLSPVPSVIDHGVLCLGQDTGDGSGASTHGTPEPGHHAHPPCCTAATAGLDALVPDFVTRPVAWPPRNAIRVAWSAERTVSARGPPGTIAHPRGPPTV